MRKRCLSLSKKDKWWSGNYYYEIYEVDGIKHIKFNYEFGRVDRDLPYLAWMVYEYNESISIPLEKFLEFDPYYQRSKTLGKPIEHLFIEPEPCWELANQLLTSDMDGNIISPKGRVTLNILKITEDTPCDYYIGV